MNSENIDDPSMHTFTNPLETPDPAAAEKAPARMLWEALTCDQAKQYFDDIAQTTGHQWREAGFAVYHQENSGYSLSELVKSDTDEDDSLKSTIEALHSNETLNMARISYNVNEQLAESAPIDHVRKDLLLRLHSHPAGHDVSRVADLLRPSAADLEFWEEAAIANPGLTEAIAVIEDDEMKVLLYRHNPQRTLIPYYQQLEGDETKAQTLRALRDSHIDLATLSYNLKTRQFAPEAEDELQRFLG